MFTIKINKLLLSFLIVFSTIANAQNLTVSSTGETGSSGTNWSISGNTLTVTGTATINASVIENKLASSSLSIQGNTTSFAVSISQNITSTSSGSGLTIGATSNTGNISINNATTIVGAMTFYGGGINISQNLTSTLSGAGILLQATGAINMSTSTTIQSNGGNITLRSNSGGTAISAASSIVLNSGSTIVSQGGNITLGGNFTGAQGAALYATSTNAPAISIDGGIISAAGGNIKLYGKCNTSYDDGIRLRGTINTTGSGTVELYGEAYGGNNGTDYFGGITFGSSAGSTIETENGSLILNGFLTNTQSNSTGAINFYRNNGSSGQTRHINLLSKTGNVTITADRGTTSAYGIGHSSWGDVYVGSPASGWIATGNVVFNYASLVNAGYNGIKVKTTGAVTYQPSAASFIADQTLPANSNYILADSASSLTIGKSSNTSSVTIASAQSIAGSISVYAGSIFLSDDLTSTAGGDITLKASNGFSTSGSTSIQRDITTSGGNILIEADSDANGTGTLDLDYMLMNAGSGTTTIRGELMNFGTVNDTDRPWISGTGVVTIESNDADFGQAIELEWFKLATGLGGLNFGKTTNTVNMYFNSAAALSFVGPVNVTGAAVTFSTALTVTTNDLNIKASGAVTQTAAVSANGLALNGTGTFALTNTSNNFATVAGGTVGGLLSTTQVTDASGGLIIGTVGSNTGIMGSGTITVETLASNLTLASNISTTSTSTDAVILTAAKSTAIGVGTGGDIILSGTPTITIGTGGIAKLFSGYDVTSTGLTNLVGGASNVRNNYDETSTTFNPVLSANNKYAIYRTALGYGDLTIVSSGGDAEGTTWSYVNGVIKTTSGAANILNTIVQTKLNSANLSIEANKIIFNANVTGTTSNALNLRSKTHIVNSSATTITTAGGDVLFASNVDDATDNESIDNGYIQFENGLTITTNGGNITLGGGDTAASSYALGASTTRYEGIRVVGILNLNSGGGNVIMRGKSYNINTDSDAWGVGFISLTTGSISSGTGTVLLDGYSQSGAGTHNSGLFSNGNLTITSANTTADAIKFIGKSTGTYGESWGVEAESGLSLIATGEGGGITMSSSIQNTSSKNDIVLRGEVNILAKSGPINLLGGQSSGIVGGNMWVGYYMYIGSKASSAVTSSSSNITLQYDYYNWNGQGAIRNIATSGIVNWKPISASFSSDVYVNWFNWNQNGQTMTGLTVGKPGCANWLYHQTNAVTVAGPISYYGGYVGVSANLTSSANGDILLKGISGGIDVEVTSTISKTAGTGTLTMQANGRVISSGPITASGTGVMNVVFWSDFDGDNSGGGVSQFGAITTNGGHVWSGGSNTNGGSNTWKGLTVGDGPSIGGSNANALDFFNNITTNGGDCFIWAGNGNGGTNGIVSNGTWVLNTGTGNITFIAPNTSGTIKFTTTGQISLAPNGGSYPGALTFGGTLSSDILTLNTSYYNGLVINNLSTVGGLTIGKYTGLLNNGTAVNIGNTSDIIFSSAAAISGPIDLFGGGLTINANLGTSNSTTGNISLNGTTVSGTGNLVLAAGRTATINISSASTYDGIISGTGSGLIKTGAGLLTLTKDHTYTGATTITGGDLQVGTGGSVSQASSGTVSTTSGVAVASGSKFILSPNENIVFAAPISGAGGVEIKGASGKYFPSTSSWLSTSAVQLVTNTSVLEALTRITGGKMGGTAVSGSVICGAYQKSYTASNNTATLQMQAFNGDAVNTYTKCVFIKLTQSGSDVMIQVNNSILTTGAGYISGNVLGTDISSGGSSMTLSTSGGAGYGISEVYMSGKVNFTGALSYSGNTVLSNTISSLLSTYNAYSYTSKGTQEITDASSSFPAASTVVNNGLILFNRTTPLTISSNMQGTEEVLQVGAAITLTGNNTYSGNTTIDLNKSLAIGSGGTSGSMTGNIVNYGSLSFNRSDASTYSGIISRSGTVSKLGASDLTLTGLNSYTGTTTINSGRLILERDVPATSSSSYSGLGILVIQPSSNSFTSAVSLPIAGFTVSNSIGGLTIGKPTNTANITFANATQAAGTITAYGGTITLNSDLTTTNNGDISLYTDNAIGGLTAARTITAAGSFNYIPRSDFFSVPVTYPITNLNLTSAGLLIGKTSNTASITFGNATTIAGPITAYGGTITLNANITTTNNGSISLYSDNPLGGLSTARTLTAAGAFKYIPRTTTFSADVTYPITNLTATSTGLTIGKTTNDKNITINQDVTGGAGIELYGANVNINSNLKTTNSGAMYLKGNTTIAAGKYIESNGAFTHDGNMTFKSTASGTAAFGSLGGTFTTVSGVTTAERYIPAKRAYRFLSSSVTSNTSIKQNWQENGSNTAGLGTHITGTGGATNGFDATATNNSSMFTYTNGAWSAITNTNINVLTAGTPYRLMVRGDRLTDLTTNTPTASPTILRATGALKTGDFLPTLNQAADGYSFVGNPYQAPIDIKAVLTASTNMNTNVVYYWDPTLNSRGTYVTRTLGIVNQNSVTSSFNQYLQPGQAVFVKKDNTANVPTMTITENHKSIVNAAAGVFKNATSNAIGILRANLKASVNNQWTDIEGALAIFHPDYSWGATQEDATKLSNLDEEVSFVQNNTSLAIAMQSNPAPSDELPIKLNTTRYTNYQWQFELTNYNGLTPYLFDSQDNTYTQIENATLVPFTVNGQEQTRFKIVFQNDALSIPEFSKQIGLSPNPGKSDSSFNLTGITNATVTLYNLIGQNIPIETSVDGLTTKVKPSIVLSQGIYVVNITQDGKTAQVKWIVE